MTLTAPGCGMAGHIAGDVENNVKQLPSINILWQIYVLTLTKKLVLFESKE